MSELESVQREICALAGQIEGQEELQAQEEETREELQAADRPWNDPNPEPLARLLDLNPGATRPDTQGEQDRLWQRIADRKRVLAALRLKYTSLLKTEQGIAVNGAKTCYHELERQLVEKQIGIGWTHRKMIEVRDSITIPGRTYTELLVPASLASAGFFDVRSPHSGVCCYIRELLARGTLTGNEPFLKDVLYRYDDVPTAPPGYVPCGIVKPAELQAGYVPCGIVKPAELQARSLVTGE
jgi:hypothetical protein